MRKFTDIPRSFAAALIFTAGFLSGSGCSSGKDKLVSVTGRATHNGNPIAGITVSFVPQAETESGASTGMTDENGQFKLTVFKTKESGAVVGAHKVWISVPRNLDVEDKEQRKRGSHNPYAGLSADVVDVLRKYGRPETSPLTIEVTGDQPIELKLD
jgi:hypothetical protein